MAGHNLEVLNASFVNDRTKVRRSSRHFILLIYGYLSCPAFLQFD